MIKAKNISQDSVNWISGTNSSCLEHIHKKSINISIYDRNIDYMINEIRNLLNMNIEFRASGGITEIIKTVKNELDSKSHNQIINDINELLILFKKVSKAKSFKLLLTTVGTNMCRKFHTDINDLRMLCTYSGPGTLWLKENNINRKALNSYSDNNDIVLDENKIQQTKEGSVILLKGAIYPQSKTLAAVHRSPTIEESGEKRLLLRIDTNEFLNFLS